MRYLKVHGSDFHWVNRNVELLYEAIEDGLNNHHLVHDAIEAINILFPCVSQRDDYQRWDNLFYEALNHASNLRDSELKTQLWARLGENFLKYGARKEADNAFEQANIHAAESQSPELLVRGYIGSLRQAAIYNRGDFAEFVQEILRLCRDITDTELLASTNSALALAYTFRHETNPALEYGRIAFVMWHGLQNHAQKAEVAYMMAEACRMVGRFDEAKRYSQLGKDSLSETDSARKTAAVFAYQTGALHLMSEQDYTNAEVQLRAAVNELSDLNFPYLIGATHHALGLTLIELGKFAEAWVSLKTAWAIWRRLENEHEGANVCHAIGYLAEKQGKLDQAQRFYLRAHRLAKQLPDSPARQLLLNDIEDDLDNLGRKT